MFNIRPFYVLLAILLCCITTTEQSIPKRVPMIAVVTGGHRSDVNIKASTQPADKGTRNIVMRVTPHQKMINEFRNILAVRVYLNTLCRRRTLYAVRSLVDTIGLNWNKPVKGYSLINRELLLSLNDPRKTLFIIRFFYAERYVGYGFTFILYGYTKRGNKLQNREISIVWLQNIKDVENLYTCICWLRNKVADGIFQQTVSKSDGCMIAGFPVLIPKGDKYKLVIKGFIGKAYIDVISSLLEVQFKVKNEKGWSWLGRIATVRINPIKPDRRFPNLQYRAALRNVRGILNHPYSVYASMTFTDVKQTIGHTFAVTFVGRRKDNRRGWARHVEISCELKRKPKPPPTTRPPPPAPRPRPRPLPPAPKPRPRPPPPAPRPRPPLPAPRPRPRPPPAPRPRPPLPAPRPRPRPQPPALRPWPRPPPPPAPRPRPPPPAPRPRPRPPPPAPRPRPPPPPAPRPRPPPPAPRPRPPPPAPRPRPQPPPPAPERKPKPPPPTRPPPPPRPRPPPPAPKPRPRPPPPAPRPRPPPPAPRPRPPPPAPRPRPPPAPRPRPRPPPPAPQPRPRPPPPKPQPRPIEPPRIIRPPPAPVRPPPRPRPVQPSTGGRINPKDDEDDEEEEEEEEEDKVSVDVKKNQSEEKSENSGMVAIAGVIVGLLIIVLIVGGLYTMKSNSQDKK